MNSKKWLLFSLCVIIGINLLACNGTDNQNSKLGVKEIKASESFEEKKNKKVEPEIWNFTKSFIKAYNQKENAFIVLQLEDLSDLPKSFLDKVEIVSVERSLLQGNEKDGRTFYSLLISCEDATFFEIIKENEVFGEMEKQALFLNKGEAVLIEEYEEVFFHTHVKAFRGVEKFSEKYIFYEENPLNTNFLSESNRSFVLHHVILWEKHRIPQLIYYTELNENPLISSGEGNVDLNGDGKEERISFKSAFFKQDEQTGKKVFAEGRLMIDDMEFSLEDIAGSDDFDRSKGYGLCVGNMEIVDMDLRDSRKEILFQIEDENTDIKGYKVYHYEPGRLVCIGKIEDEFNQFVQSRVDQENKSIVCDMRSSKFVCNYTYPKTYVLRNKQLVKKEEKSTILADYERRIILLVAEELNLYEGTNVDKIVMMLKRGSTINFLETDHENWIKVKDFDTGKIGYLRFDYEGIRGIQFYQQPGLEIQDALKRLPAAG